MDYKIPLNSVQDGKNDYSFSLDKKFFDEFSGSDILDGNIDAELQITKNYKGLECYVHLNGKVKVTCDKCLDEYFEDITYNGKLYFEFGNETQEVTDELIYLSKSEDFIDFGQYIYEFIELSLPIQKFHPVDEDGNILCNPEMLKRIEELTNNKKDNIDPRWAQLQELKTKK